MTETILKIKVEGKYEKRLNSPKPKKVVQDEKLKPKNDK
jgi:hypothetical protein